MASVLFHCMFILFDQIDLTLFGSQAKVGWMPWYATQISLQNTLILPAALNVGDQ